MNEQIAQALAQLRDIHEPAAPAFWPLPIGWWILAALLVACLACLVWWLYTRRRADRPYRQLREATGRVQQLVRANELSNAEYLATVNRLYKHLLIEIEPTPGSRQAHGALWLTMLADRFNNDDFVTGAGKSLGTIRYAPLNYFDERIVSLVEQTLAVVKPTKRSRKPT